MNHYAAASLLNSIFVPILGLYVFYSKRNKTNLLFLLHGLAIGFWSFGFFKTCFPSTPEQGLFWARALHIGALFIPVFLLHFIISLLNRTQTMRPILWIAYSFAFIMLILVPTPYFVSHTFQIPDVQYFVGPAGLQYHLFTIFFASSIIYALFLSFQGFQKTTGLQRTQLKFVFIASAVGYCGGAGAFLPLFGIHPPTFTLYSISLYCLIIAFSIIRYRLFDIEIILKKMFYHFSVFLLTTLIFTMNYLIVAHFSSAPFTVPYLAIMIATSFAITYLVHHYHQKLDTIAEKAINNKRRKMYDTLQKIPAHLKGITEIKELYDFLCAQITNQLNVDYTAAYSLNHGKTTFKLMSCCIKNDFNLPNEISMIDPIIKHMTFDLFETEVARRELSTTAQHIYLLDHIDQHFKASLFIPLMIQKTLAGIIMIGYHRERMGYTDRELLILKNIGIQAALVLENITLYDQVIRENRLELIGTMAASLAHEIRNPLTSIRTFVEMLPNKTNDANFMDRFNRLIPGEVDRLLELTNSILRFSQAKEPCIEQIDFQTVFDKSLTLLKNNLRDKKINVSLAIKGAETIFADNDQFLQVLLNLLLNAIQASPENAPIEVQLHNAEQTTIRIIDHGCGIAPQNIERVFEPFYSSKIYGTGLGLANCQRIIESHYGHLAVESELEKGSTFTITLPLKKRDS